MQPLDMSSIMYLVRLDCYVSWAVWSSWQLTLVCASRLPDSSLSRPKLSSHTDHALVHHLSQADLIMVLGEDGRVVNQGRFTELRDKIDDLTHIAGIQLTQTDEAERGDELPELPNKTAESIHAPSTDGQRQETDLAVYKYYFSALGWLRISALLLFLITEAGMSGLRCELRLLHFYIWVI
jgi:hypothetical protein